MAQKRIIRRQDLEGLESGLSQVSGSTQERFFQNLLDYFAGWLSSNASSIAKGHVSSDRALLVVFSESPDLYFTSVAGNSAVPVEVFASTHTLGDGVALATENLSKVLHAVPNFKGGANEALTFVRTHLSADQTFALLMLGQERMLVHEAGVQIDEWLLSQRVIPISRLSESLITPNLIDEQLNEFHVDALSSYRGTTARLMWQISEAPTLSVLGPNPELHVQSALLTYFRGIYRKTVAFADEEVALNEGRVDIRIARADKVNGRAVTMLELKVLDPKKSDGENLKWAHKGIKQAHGYMKTRDTDAAFACIYDARRDKSNSMSTLASDAEEKGVRLKLQPMEVPNPRPTKERSASRDISAVPTKSGQGRTAPEVTTTKKSLRPPAVKAVSGSKTSSKKI